MKILVTGGAGFIGRYLAEFLVQKNKILIFDNLSTSSKKDIDSLVKKGAEFLRGDILDVETLCEFSKE